MRPALPFTLCAILAGCAGPLATRPVATNPAAPSTPPSGEQAVLAVVQRTFDAMAARDTSALRALFVPGATLAVVDSLGGVQQVPLGGWLRSIASARMKPTERMFRPRVERDGAMAMLWTYYTFHLDQQFSHCGVNAVALVRQGDAWKIRHIDFTMRRTGCTETTLQ